jgi:purine-binding chemotaxis protein CheW
VVEVELEGQQTVLGVLTDAVNQVIELSDSNIQPPPPFGTRVQLEFLRGLGEVESGFVLVLDIDRLLTNDELLAAYPALVEEATEPLPSSS